MTYISDQNSAELRAHMRRLKKMNGWHQPLVDRLFKEVQEQDTEIERLRAKLKTAGHIIEFAQKRGFEWPVDPVEAIEAAGRATSVSDPPSEVPGNG